jgi:hypothetical protein
LKELWNENERRGLNLDALTCDEEQVGEAQGTGQLEIWSQSRREPYHDSENLMERAPAPVDRPAIQSYFWWQDLIHFLHLAMLLRHVSNLGAISEWIQNEIAIMRCFENSL